MKRTARGFTLVELVVAIVLIAMASITIVGMLSSVGTRSAETLLQTQAVNVADAYLREALSKEFADPDGVTGESRANADDVDDYNFTEAGAHDHDGTPIVGFEDYQVTVSAVPQAFNGIPPAQSRLVTVTVLSPTQVTTRLAGYKTSHPK